MSDAPVQTQGGVELQPPLPVRRLHNFIYCPRLFYFQWVENIFQENADTVAGTHVHRNVDAPSRLDDPKELGLPEGICDPKRLRQVARSLEGFGVRLQYSVFECPLDDLRLAKLKAELQDLLNHDEDQVLFVSLGASSNDVSLIIEAMGLPYEVRSRVTII